MLLFVKNVEKLACLVLFATLTLFYSNEAKSQTTLYAGDVAFVSCQMNNNTGDTFAIVLLKNIDAGTQIVFTDGCWKDANGYFVLTSAKTEWYFIWEAAGALPKGTIIKYWNSSNAANNSGGTPNASTGTIVKGDALSLNHNGGTDQVFALQDTVSVDLTNNRLTVNRYLAGIHFDYITGLTSDANWDGTASATGLFQSELPDSLVNGVSALRVDSVASSAGKRENAVMTSNYLSLDKTVINDRTNWTIGNTPQTTAIPLRCTWTGSWDITPTSSLDAIIQSSSAPGTFTCRSLRVDTTYNLTVTSGNATNIYGDFYNYGDGVGSSDGDIEFYKTGTAYLYGSTAISTVGVVRVSSSTTLTTNNLLTLDATGPSTYGQIGAGGSYNGAISGNITAKYLINSGGYGWRSICSPLDGATLADIDDDVTMNYGTPDASFTNVYTYDESGSSPHWHPGTSNSQSMDNGGFALFLRDGDVPVTIDITGTYHGTSNYVKSGLTKTGSTTDTSGWHYLRNPWPTSFYWDGSISNVQGAAAYIYDQSGGTYMTFDNINDGIIPPFTAIIIKVTSNNVSVTMPNSYRNVAYGDNYFDKKFPADNYIGLTLKNLQTGVSDLARFYTDDNAQNDYDYLDADKKMNDPRAPSIYFTMNGVKLNKQAWNNIPDAGADLPVSIYTTRAGSYEISSQIENMAADVEITLEDKKEQKLHDVRKGNYNLDIIAGDNSDRFVLHLRKKGSVTTGADEAKNATCFIGSNGSVVSIGSTQNDNLMVEITDLLGKIVYKNQIPVQGGNVSQLAIQAPATGYYVVKVTGTAGTQVAKVYLK